MTQTNPSAIEPQIEQVLGFTLDGSNYKRQPTKLLKLFMLLTSPRLEYIYSASTIDLRYAISKELELRRGHISTSLTMSIR